MTTDASNLKGHFEITGWEESPYHRHGNVKLTRVSAAQRFHGAIEGEGTVEWLMYYRPDGTADFVGLQRIEGTIDGLSGVLVARSIGQFDGTTAIGEWTVIDESATAELSGAIGSGRFEAPMGGTPSFELELMVPAAADAASP